MFYLKVYWKLIKVNLKSLTQYRADFIIGVISMLLLQCSNIFFIATIFMKVSTINGWSSYEVMYLYVMASLTVSIYKIFFSSLVTFPEWYIKNGNFDVVLIKPVSELYYIITQSFAQSEIPGFVVNVVLLSGVLLKLKASGVVFSVLISIIIAMLGSIIIAAFSILICCLSFKYTEVFMAIKLLSGLTEFAKYPMEIFPRVIQGFFTFVIPFAFISYYPAKAVIYNETQYYFGILLVSFLSAALAIGVWKFTLKRYESTGT